MRYIPIDNQGMGGPEPEEDPRLRKMFNMPGAGYMPAYTPQQMPQPVMPQLSFAPDVQMPQFGGIKQAPAQTGGVKPPIVQPSDFPATPGEEPIPPTQSVGSAVMGGMDAAKQGGGKGIFDKIKSIGA